jgi:putative DNA primase/helicase
MSALQKTNNNEYPPLSVTRDFTENPLLDIVRDVESNTSTDGVDHDEVLDKMLEQIQPVDFVALAGVDDKSKLNGAHYRILSIESILSTAQKNNWGLCRNLDFIYLFNGCYWALISEEDIKDFLGRASEKMGVHWEKSRDHNYKDQLLKQFISSAHLTKRSRNGSVLINLKNGTFEIQNGKGGLRHFDRNDFLTYQLPFDYNPEAKAQIFEKYLNEVLPDKSRQLILAEYIGYLFVKELKLEKALILFGGGANGKSVAFDVIISLLGIENVSNYSLSSLTNTSGYQRAGLANKLLNYAPEINGKLEAALFKQLVSGEPIEARLPYGQPMILRDYARLMFNTNELPKEGIEHTHAFFRRFLIIPFDVTISDEKKDVDLGKKIISNELPGVFNWVLSGLDRILNNRNFTSSDAVKNQLNDYRKESNPVAMFLEESGYKKSVDSFVRLTPDLYNEFCVYCTVNGHHKPNSRTLSERLKNLGYESGKKTGWVVFYISKV